MITAAGKAGVSKMTPLCEQARGGVEGEVYARPLSLSRVYAKRVALTVEEAIVEDLLRRCEEGLRDCVQGG